MRRSDKVLMAAIILLAAFLILTPFAGASPLPPPDIQVRPIQAGSTAPASSCVEPNDFYIDYAALTLYCCQSGGTWAACGSSPPVDHNLFSAAHPDVDESDTPGDDEILTFDSGTGLWSAEPSSGHLHTHASTTGQTTDDHHPKSHAHDGADGSGTIAHVDTTGRTANDHHNQSHVIADTTALGPDHTTSGLSVGQVLRASGATTAAFAAIQSGDLPSHSHDHGADLTGLSDQEDHDDYVTLDGTRAMTANWDAGDFYVIFDGGYGSGKVPTEKVDILLDDDPGLVARLSNYGGIGSSGTPQLQGRAARGTVASPSATNNQDRMLSLIGIGHDGSGFASSASASVILEASETHTASAKGGRIEFFTVDNTTTTLDRRMLIDHDGEVGIGTETPANLLDVAGTAEMDVAKITTGATINYVLADSDGAGTGAWTDPDTLVTHNPDQNLWATFTADVGSTTANTTTDTLTVSGATGISTSITGDTLSITNDSPNVDQDLFKNVAVSGQPTIVADSTTDTLTLAGGTGITLTTDAGTDTLTVTNSSPNSDQNLWESVVADTGSTTADTTTDQLTVSGGSGISTSITGDTLTITATGGGGSHAILDGSTHTDSVAQTVSTGSMIYGNATPKWDELTIGALGTVLQSNGTTPFWGGLSIGNNLLDGVNHADTVADTVSRGSLVYGNATPKWDELVIGGSGTVLTSDGTDVSWQTPSGGSGAAQIGFSGGASTVSKGSTDYLGIGTGSVSGTIANQEFYVTVAGTISKFYVYVSANTTGASNTVTLMKNGAAQSVTVTFGSGVTGLQSDTSNSFSVAAGDRVAIRVINNGSGGGAKDLVVESVSFQLS